MALSDSPPAPSSTARRRRDGNGPGAQQAPPSGTSTVEGQRLPPHSLEAEQGLLGSILIAPDEWIDRCVEQITERAFYFPAHQTIFEVVVGLRNASKPVELITILQTLRDKSSLEAVGGPAAISQLYTVVPTAANAAHYLEIVREKHVLRQVITVCTECASSSYDPGMEANAVLDEVERKVLAIAESRSQSSIPTMKEDVLKAIQTIETLYERRGQVTGLPTGFVELDRMTNGLHGSEMFVIAARPSMGKCVAAGTQILEADGSVTPIEELVARQEAQLLTLGSDWRFRPGKPSGFLDDGEKPVVRMVTQSGRMLEATLPHPLLTLAGWKPLGSLRVGDWIAVPRALAVFGGETARLSELDLLACLLAAGDFTRGVEFSHPDPAIRAHFRATCAAFGVHEIRRAGWHAPPARRQRALASTARHIHTGRSSREDVVASHAQVLRIDDADCARWSERLGLAGCPAADKFIPAFVFRLSRDQLAHFLARFFECAGTRVHSHGAGRLRFHSASRRMLEQLQHLLLRFGVDCTLRTSRNGLLSTRGGAGGSWALWLRPEALDVLAVDAIALGQGKPQPASEADDLVPAPIWSVVDQARGSGPWATLFRRAGLRFERGWRGRGIPRGHLRALATTLENPRLQELADGDVRWERIRSLENAGLRRVYDLCMPGTHNFVANDICVHNTALAMNIAEHVAMVEKKAVAIFSLEMSRLSLVQRLLCSHARVNMGKIRDGFLSARDFENITTSASKLHTAPMFIDDTSGLSILELRAKSRRLKSMRDIQLIVIDYLQLLRSPSKRAQENRQLEVAEISSGIKALSKELNIPIIVLAQLNRQPEARQGGRPMLSHLRESGSIEQDADVVALLVRSEYYADDEEDKAEKQGEAELIIAKQRNGPTGDVKLTFLKEFTRFENRAPEPMNDRT